MKKRKKIILAACICLLAFPTLSFTASDSKGTANYEALSKLNPAMFSDSETCNDDCSFDAQAAYGRNVEDLRDALGVCLDHVMDDLILAYTAGLSYQHASSNFESATDLLTESNPEAMACIGAADQAFEDSIGDTGDDWADCSNGCDL